MIKRSFRSFAVSPKEGIGQDDEFPHHGGDGNLGGFTGGNETLVLDCISLLNRVATSAGV